MGVIDGSRLGWPMVKCGRADVDTGKMQMIFAEEISGCNR